eukprot:TRINITY_DN2123_c0_g3_i2.p1 TRINITY_DN2123_c0_g3~~TRINITY_DN2123_c0_g3_i2.p1  ORF type:complete len:110 (-),score=26.29 TRINITY_DN2123_c0_g3_i2:40-369(-)
METNEFITAVSKQQSIYRQQIAERDTRKNAVDKQQTSNLNKQNEFSTIIFNQTFGPALSRTPRQTKDEENPAEIALFSEFEAEGPIPSAEELAQVMLCQAMIIEDFISY